MSQKITFDFIVLRGRRRGLSGLKFYFFQKEASEMDSAYQKTYVSTPHITENDKLIFWPPRPY